MAKTATAASPEDGGEKKISPAALTRELKRLGMEVYQIADDGTGLTREQVLADMIWKQALGYSEKKRDDRGNYNEIWHPPVARWQEFLFERMEGKAPQAQVEESGGLKAKDKVAELAKERLNKLARVAVGPPKSTQVEEGRE